MNLTRIIEETGRRIRAGKMPAEKLTNADVKEILEVAVEVMKEALIQEERIEIQNFAVMQVKRILVKSAILNGKATKSEWIVWLLKPSKSIQILVK